MAKVTFELNGCEELAAKINEVLEKYPNETATEMEKITNDFKKDVNALFPNKGKSGKSYAIAKNWKKFKVTNLKGYTVEYEMQNVAPHFHLVENGHETWISPEMYAAYKSGNLQFASNASSKKANRNKEGYKKKHVLKDSLRHMGFTAGKHCCEKTRNVWKNGEYTKRVEKHVTKLLKKCDLT